MAPKQPHVRTSGLLLHITSLPSPYGVGDLGPEARRFIDFLEQSGQTVWQMLPLNPTDPYTGNSPYLSNSAFAGNPLLISPDLLTEQGLLSRGVLGSLELASANRVDFTEAWARKNLALEKAFAALAKSSLKADFETFCHEQAAWLDDYALFIAIKRAHGGAVWNTWSEELRRRQPAALKKARSDYARQIEKEQFIQFLFHTQFSSLKTYASEHKVRLFGDLPIYVGYDSADVWAHPTCFKLDDDGNPAFVSGVPPDYFSKTGQLWNTPVYDWSALSKDGFDWWVRRLKAMHDQFDIIRIDHFRGLVQYWEIKAGEPTAENGQWQDVPTKEFLTAIRSQISGLDIVAEDLGIITDDVKEVMQSYGFPGMKILLFAFNNDDPLHPYLTHNFTRECAVYTGTHDNNTVRGWLSDELTEIERKRMLEYAGIDARAPGAVWDIIRLASMSVADSAVFQVQDILEFGSEARMNTPSTPRGNWEWRLQHGQLTHAIAERLKRLSLLYGRTPRKTTHG